MYKKRNGKIGVVLACLVVIALIVGGIYWFVSTYSIKTVYVEGNVHYTQEEIKNIVMEGPLDNNSFFLSMKYRNKGVENIPFVDVMDVSVLAPDTIKIIVYEKSLAGYVEFMDSYMYFDRDGYVVETSNVKTVGVPQISGLEFNHVVFGEKIPVREEGIFETIMTVTNLLDKFELSVDKIHFQTDLDMVLFFGEIRVILGKGANLEEKIMVLPTFLSELEGQKGVLRLDSDSMGENLSVFELDKSEEKEESD